MKVTALTQQVRNPDRVNVSVDGKYSFSLDVFQVGELGIKLGAEYDDSQIESFKNESLFGKLYVRTMQYCLLRPHSQKEVEDYLRRKAYDGRKIVYSEEIRRRVVTRLKQKGLIDDKKFADFWIENRNRKSGISLRKLRAELASKGVDGDTIDLSLLETQRNDSEEIAKIVAKKKDKYSDEKKLVEYLARKGFSYDDIKGSLQNS